MKILFIYPQVNSQISFNYGLSYISAVLKRQGHEVRVLNIHDALGLPMDLDEVEKKVVSFSPDVVGFSIVTPQMKYALAIAGRIRKKLNVPLVAGGVHPTMAPLDTLKKGFDYVCVGEGEEFFKAFVEFLEGKLAETLVPNMGYLKNGKLVRNRLAPFVDVKKLPMKDYTSFDFQRMIEAKGGWVGLMASRGCPFRCTYCVNHALIKIYREEFGPSTCKNYVRFHTPEQVIEEIDYLLRNYRNIKFFIFDDDLFTFDRGFVEGFCKLYKKHFKIPFVVNAHVKVFSKEIALLLKDAGCRIVKFGIESGSERVRREVLGRRMSNLEMKKALEICEEVGLHSSCFVMFGLPTETKEEIMETIRFLAEAKPGRFRWSVFYPFPGTKAYEMCKELGILPENVGELDNFFEGTCLMLREEEKLFIEKLAKVYPWFVNGELGGLVGWVYKSMAEKVIEVKKGEWDRLKMVCRTIDELVSKLFDKTLHYSIRFNPFMAVRSDWKE